MLGIKNISLVLVILIFIASSCSVQKKSYKAPIKEEGVDYLLSQMKANENHFNTFSGKAIAYVTNQGKRNELKINLRIQKDSLIWVSVSAGIGIEAARIILTRDSVLFLNRLEKTYFTGNYQFISELIHARVDFDIVQAVLTGNDFSWYDYQDLKATVSNDQYQLESAHRRKLKKHQREHEDTLQTIYQSMWLNPSSFKIEKIKIKEINKENKKIIAAYSQFKDVSEQILPMQYDITITAAQKDIIIDATFIKVVLDNKLNFPFNIPSKYTEIR